MAHQFLPRNLLEKLIAVLPVKFRESLERQLQDSLGKGSGAWSTSQEVDHIAEILKQKSIKDVVAIDAGANEGDWSIELLAAFPNSRIAAFEPSKAAYAKLSNRFKNIPNINCQNLALGKENSNQVLYSDKEGSGLASLTKRRVDHFGIDFLHHENVEVTTLDKWTSINGFEPQLLKIDVEGHELDVLKGSIQTLTKLEVVQFEFGGSNIDTRTYFQDFWYFFNDINFSIFRIAGSSLIPLMDYKEQDETFRTTNYLAVRK